ncbi:RNA polymerase sigma factor SigM [Pseudonocardia sp. CA-107938]|uniref:RNA polymerase sigma factor SigM n=1 Tax=Pseudonocardia sp. CA-107938 TaxID=3240021 RepID=UPI003D91C688
MTQPVPTDAELMVAHQAGDRAAFGLLVNRHARKMWSVAVRTLGNAEDADDAVQEALEAAFKRAGSFRGRSAVSTWLHRIVVNACIDRMRHDRVRRTVPLPDAEPQAARRIDPAAELATRLAVDAALAELSVDHRIAVVLVDMEGWSVADAAQILDVRPGTVKSRCARGRAKLAVLLGHLREEAG